MNGTNNTKQAFWIALGSLFSFGFGIISSVILSRYLSKADYGTYKQVLYVYSTLLTLFTLGLPKAYSYFLPRVEIGQARGVIRKITNLFFLLGGVFSATIFFAAGQIAELLRNPDLELVLKIFSPVPLLMLPTMGLEGVLATYRMTKFMAVYSIVTRLMMLGCVAIPVVYFGGNYIQAIIGFVVASVVAFGLALFFKYYPVRLEANKKCDTQYKEIFQFSLPILYASLWGMLISSADQFFISRYFGQEIFAEFANGSLELPFVGMIIGATSAVLSPIFSKLRHESLDPKSQIFPIWKSAFEKSAMLTYPLLLYVWFFADVLMVFLYGEQYEKSAIYFRIITVASFFSVIVYAPLVISIGKVKYYADVHMYGAIALISLEALCVIFISSPYVVVAVSVACRLAMIYFMLRLVAVFFGLRVHQLFPVNILAKILIPSSLALLMIRSVLDQFAISELSILLLGGVSYAVAFMLLAWVLRLDYSVVIRPLFARAIK
jgi:O-antigen/teichoic acid export membrane protein